MEHETTKLKEQEELYARELREWKAHLKPRKQVIISWLYYIKYILGVYNLNKYIYISRQISIKSILSLICLIISNLLL